MLSVMEPNAAEDLPALYRAVLDRIAELEAAGDRRVARQVRIDAIGIYSRAWDDRAQRRLKNLLRRTCTGSIEVAPARRTVRGFSTSS